MVTERRSWPENTCIGSKQCSASTPILTTWALPAVAVANRAYSDDWVLSVTTTWPPRASTPAMTNLTKWLFPRPSGPKIPMEPELSMS